ncbi:MAG TPA: penicillin-binding protein 1C [Gemmatimonadaceae bacterium]|nr:penicillin-binding protein 1C [Gemmatimonadaceae bacterium]
MATPIPAEVLAPMDAPSVTLTDRHGVVLRTTRAADGSRARWMPIDQIDPQIITAFIAVEDRRFLARSNRGALGAIDARALARAVRDNLRARRIVSGASTITMQTARLVRPSGRGWGGKLTQALWALRLSAHLSSGEILEQYLNRVQLGQGAVGVPAAAMLYAGASARSVSLAQAALLAGIAHAPSSDNPLVSPRRAHADRSRALTRILRAGYASSGDVERARREPLLTTGDAAPFLAPHFTTRVLGWLDRDAYRGGVLRTSLDIALQRQLEAEVRRTVRDLHAEGARQAAAVVLDNHSGEILAWVGSPDFWADTGGQTDMVVSARQPGSALKPFLYGLAFDRGLTPATILADIPHEYRTSTGPYRPRNYDQRYHGPVRAREALASSFNVPAVALADRVSAASLLATLHNAGFASLSRSADYYGLGLALGNGDVTLLELANAYRSLANGGVWRPLRWSAADGAGATSNVLPAAASDAAAGRRVMSPLSAALVLDILSDADARIPGFGLQTPLEFPFRAAAKTGTSRHFTDNWAVATTAGFTVAVWVGNFSGRPMEGVSGVSGAGPLLHRATLLTARRYAPGLLPTPASAGARPVEICRLSGLRAAHGCPHMTEWFAPGAEPTDSCDWHRADGSVVLPQEYAAWLERREGDGAVDDGALLAASRISIARGDEPASASTAESHSDQPSDSLANAGEGGGTAGAARRPTDARGAGFRIVSPRDGDRYQVPAGVDPQYSTVALRAAGARDPAAVRWSVDGRAYRRSRLPLTPGEHVIRAFTSRGDSAEVRIVVE